MKVKDKWTTTTTTYELGEPFETVSARGRDPIRNVIRVSVSFTDYHDGEDPEPKVRVQGVMKGNRNHYWHLVSREEDERILRELGIRSGGVDAGACPHANVTWLGGSYYNCNKCRKDLRKEIRANGGDGVVVWHPAKL